MKAQVTESPANGAAQQTRRRERQAEVDARLAELFRKSGQDPLLDELRKVVRDHLLEKE
jgi:hypothetical protein